MWWAWAVLGAIVAAVAFVLRVSVHVGRSPGGVDTWYYLAYADAVRKRPSFDVRLPQYLLQDERQSYPPLFPMLLALLPRGWLLRWHWTISPAVDCAHLLLLYWLTFRITDSLAVSGVTAAIYALTPHLVSETRSLSGRSFGALLHSVAMVLAMRHVAFEGGPASLAAALLAGAAVYLASATSSAAYGIACAVLSLVFRDPSYVLLAAAAMLVAAVVSGGHYLRVVGNYVHALRYWRRNRGLFGAHPVRHSPVYGRPHEEPVPARPGFLGRGVWTELLRLLGENPFILVLPLAAKGTPPWGVHLYWWGVSLVGLAVLATVLAPLRAFGPGRSLLKCSVFPTAYTLALGMGSASGLVRPIGIMILTALCASAAAILYFFLYSRRQGAGSVTSYVPDGLARAAAYLASCPGDGVLVLPSVYADYTCYHSGKSVLWGGHCGDLRRLEEVAPVLVHPLPEMARTHGVRYLLLDHAFAMPGELGLVPSQERGIWDGIGLYEIAGPPRV
jgi:hypothetical protein